MQTECQVAANPRTKPTDVGGECPNSLLPSALTIAIYYYYTQHIPLFYSYSTGQPVLAGTPGQELEDFIGAIN